MGGVIFVQDCPTCARCKLQDWPGGIGGNLAQVGVIGQNLCKMQVARLAMGSGRQSCTSWGHWTELVQDASCKIGQGVLGGGSLDRTCARCKSEDWPGGLGGNLAQVGIIGQNLCKMQVARLCGPCVP